MEKQKICAPIEEVVAGAMLRRSFVARVASVGVVAAMASMLLMVDASAQDKVLRVVPLSNLTILDPIWTTVSISTYHSYMIYDTLFGTDEKGTVKPQMVESWIESADHRLWTFKLRKGLEFHDGKAVTGEDVIASLQRWGKRDAVGGALMQQFVQRMDSPSPDTFRIFLGEPCSFVLEALGQVRANVPFIMPKRIAETDAFKQIEEHIGSGPYIFKKDEFKPGDKAVYVRNPKYVPRNEPPSGTTGGKRVYVDRVEWNLALRDAQAQMNALKKGEIDIVESVALDYYESAKNDPDFQLPKVYTWGLQFFGIFNQSQKPFDNPQVRRAAIAAMPQEPFLRAQVGVKELYRTCYSMFICDTPYGSTAGSDIQAKSNMKKAQELLKVSGYDGTPIVILKPTDEATLSKTPDVAAQFLRQAGFKVDLQAMDWQTLVTRRAKKDGWNMFVSNQAAAAMWNPIVNRMFDTRGEKSTGWGWPADNTIVEMRNAFMRATDEATKKNLAEQLHARAFEIGLYAPLGERGGNVLAARKNISGFFTANAGVYWNLMKN